MTVYVIVGHNKKCDNVSARAAYSTRAEAEAHLVDPTRMWFDDRAVIVELEVDQEVRASVSVRTLDGPLDMPEVAS